MMATEDTRELAAEFKENGLNDLASYMLDHSREETLGEIERQIAEVREYDPNDEGWVAHNLEVARDRLS